MTAADLPQTPRFDASTVDATARPSPRVPAGEVVEVLIRYPWVQGSHELRAWWDAVETVLGREWGGDSLAAVLDSADAAICEDLGDQAGWRALYPAPDADRIEARIAEVFAPILAAAAEEDTAGVVEGRPLLVEIRPFALAPGEELPWGDDVSQVVLCQATSSPASMKPLTDNQKRSMRIALTLWRANGAATSQIRGEGYRSLMKRGYFTSHLTNSIAGGREVRCYKFTAAGLAEAERVVAEAVASRAATPVESPAPMSLASKVMWDAISAYVENAEDCEEQWTREAADGDEAAKRSLAELAEARRIQASFDAQMIAMAA